MSHFALLRTSEILNELIDGLGGLNSFGRRKRVNIALKS